MWRCSGVGGGDHWACSRFHVMAHAHRAFDGAAAPAAQPTSSDCARVPQRRGGGRRHVVSQAGRVGGACCRPCCGVHQPGRGRVRWSAAALELGVVSSPWGAALPAARRHRFCDAKSQHLGTSVDAGVKYVLQQWYLSAPVPGGHASRPGDKMAEHLRTGQPCVHCIGLPWWHGSAPACHVAYPGRLWRDGTQVCALRSIIVVPRILPVRHHAPRPLEPQQRAGTCHRCRSYRSGACSATAALQA